MPNLGKDTTGILDRVLFSKNYRKTHRLLTNPEEESAMPSKDRDGIAADLNGTFIAIWSW